MPAAFLSSFRSLPIIVSTAVNPTKRANRILLRAVDQKPILFAQKLSNLGSVLNKLM